MRRLYNIHPDEELFVSFKSREPLLPDASTSASADGVLLGVHRCVGYEPGLLHCLHHVLQWVSMHDRKLHFDENIAVTCVLCEQQAAAKKWHWRVGKPTTPSCCWLRC